MKNTTTDKLLPSVAIHLRHLSEYIRIARKRRRMTMAEVAERLNLGYQTIVRIENGDPGVSISSYMSTLWLFDLSNQFTQSLHPDKDETGKSLECSRLPERVGRKRVTGENHDF